MGGARHELPCDPRTFARSKPLSRPTCKKRCCQFAWHHSHNLTHNLTSFPIERTLPVPPVSGMMALGSVHTSPCTSRRPVSDTVYVPSVSTGHCGILSAEMRLHDPVLSRTKPYSHSVSCARQAMRKSIRLRWWEWAADRVEGRESVGRLCGGECASRGVMAWWVSTARITAQSEAAHGVRLAAADVLHCHISRTIAKQASVLTSRVQLQGVVSGAGRL